MSFNYAYSTPDELKKVREEIAKTATAGKAPLSSSRKPMMVLDLDGNVLIGYNSVSGTPLAEGLPDNQHIPFTYDIAAGLEKGDITAALHAVKNADVRLSHHLAAYLQERNSLANPYYIVFLTSRDLASAKAILEASGVPLERTVLFADSGATALIGDGNSYEEHVFYTPSAEEKAVLDNMASASAQINDQGRSEEDKTGLSFLEECEAAVNIALGELNYDPEGRPELAFQQKHLGNNVDYRPILDHFGEAEGGPIDKTLQPVLRLVAQDFLNREQLQSDAPLNFKILAAPGSIELKSAGYNKGDGLEKILTIAKDHGAEPSALVYAGDDICTLQRSKAVVGTDYYAFARGEAIAHAQDIPFFGIHTLHPEKEALLPEDVDLNQVKPNPQRMARGIEAERFDEGAPKIDAVTHSPDVTAKMVVDTLKASEKHLAEQRGVGGRADGKGFER